MQDKTDEFSSSYETARGTVYMMMKNLVFGLSGFVFFILIARFLPHVSDLGLVNGLFSMIAVGVLLASLGLPNAIVRFVPYLIGTGKEELAKGIRVLIFRIGFISSIAFSFAIYVSAYHIATIFFHNTSYIHLIQIASVDVFLFTMINYSTYMLISLKKFRRVAAISVLNSILKFAMPFVLLIIGMGVEGVVIGFSVGDAISLAIFLYILRPSIRISSSIHQIRSLFNYSMPVYGSIVLNFLSGNIDYILLLALTNLNTAGVYSPAIIIGAGLTMILQAFEQSLLPHFSRTYGESGIDLLKVGTKLSSRYLFLIFFPLGFAIVASASPLVIGIFGEKYVESIVPSVIIILTITVVSVGSIFNNVLLSAGYSRILLTSISIAISVQLVLSICTIPSFGPVGAALSRSSSYIIGLIYPAYRLRKIAGGLNYDHTALSKGLVGSLIMALTIFTLNLFLAGLYFLPLNLFVGFVSYVTFLRFTRTLNTGDFEIINNVLGGKLTRQLPLIERMMIR